jgi:hypothetical protein
VPYYRRDDSFCNSAMLGRVIAGLLASPPIAQARPKADLDADRLPKLD